ncbi:MAG TPA: FG-GAP-like repeat-containing protein, partial [Dongiaceae bacterium]|nr:FG-GAP-like repeat-containing protein [Dongiaceae bacterium]
MKQISFRCWLVLALGVGFWGPGLRPAAAQPAGAAAISLDGVNNYLQVPAATWFSNDFTVEAWVYARSYNAWSRVIDFANGPNNYNVYLAFSGGTSGLPYMGVFALNGSPVLAATSQLPLNQWVHLAATLSGTNGTIYLNGTVIASGPQNVAAAVLRTNDYFGRSNYAPDGYANAIFDEIRIWNVARSAADLQTYRDSRLTGTEPGLVGYWRFDEGTGTVTTNVLGTGAAQLVNGPTWVVSTIATADTLTADSITSNSASLNGTVCPGGYDTAGWFEWGQDTSYGTNSDLLPLGSGLTFTNFSFAVAGLAPGMTYHFRAVATNAVGVQYGPDRSFTTAPAAPQVITAGLHSSTASSATLAGYVNPHGLPTTAWCDWGLTTNYDQATAPQSAGSGAVGVIFFADISGLTATTTYHFRAAASNSLGVVYGEDNSFVTPLPVMFNPAVYFPTGATFFATSASVLAWGDYDNDGLLDVAQIGSPTGPTGQFIPIPAPRTYLFHNTGSGFADVTDTVAPGLSGADATYGIWIDFDNDGRLDLLVNGAATHLWLNTTNGFINDTNIALPSLAGGVRMAVADYDADGRPDVLVAGVPTQLWHNTASGFVKVTDLVAPGLAAFSASSAAWGDYDRDGLPDFVVAGSSGLQLWRNTGNGFTNVTNQVMPGVGSVTPDAVAWGDLNNDGTLDLVCGSATNGATQVWLNTGLGLTNAPEWIPVDGALGSAISLGDFDNDGRLDVLGSAGQIWRNQGTNFVSVGDQVAPNLPFVSFLPGLGLALPTVAFGDYNNDGRLDLLLGGYLIGETAQVWNNSTAHTNVPPLPPTGLYTSFNSNTVTLHWNVGSDANTPAPGLTYNLRLGTTPGGAEIINPLAGTDGRLRLPLAGNRQETRSFELRNLQLGQRYYWGVQTVDSAYAGSTFATGTFALGALPLPPGGVLIPGDLNGDGVVSPDELAQVVANLDTNSAPDPATLALVLADYWSHTSIALTNVLGLGSTNVTFIVPDAPT